MKYEKSCGAVIFRKDEDWNVLLIRHTKGKHVSFPKGHMEGDETETETALREIWEETGLRPVIIDGFCERLTFSPKEKRNTWKQVTFFLAEADDAAPAPREGEVNQVVCVPYEEALLLFRFEDMRRILQAAHSFLMR